MGVKKLFGTDGIRGTFGGKIICEKSFRAIGRALGCWMSIENCGRIFLGNDGRSSAKILEGALIDGLPAAVEILHGGTLPTPAIAHAAKIFGAKLAIAVTASHNPATANGLKFFDGDGRKWSLADEARFENVLFSLDNNDLGSAQTARARVIDVAADAISAYETRLLKLMPANCLEGKIIAIDTANGAASQIAAKLFTKLGAVVHAVGNKPDGNNINGGCGSEHPHFLRDCLQNFPADWGVALDGDGDRALICNRFGETIPGEHLMAAIAMHLRAKTLVTTVLANGAMDGHLRKHSVETVRTAVGDRNVAEAMVKWRSCFGGEPSGHYIWNEAGHICDGLLSAALFFSAISSPGFDENLWCFQLNPSAFGSIVVERIIPLETAKHFAAAKRDCEKELGESGRVVARYSGTEDKLRLVVECKSGTDPEAWIKKLGDAFLADCGNIKRDKS